jgi:hypothetical protein
MLTSLTPTGLNSALSSSKGKALRLVLAFGLFLILCIAAGAAHALPGSETAEDAVAGIAERSEAQIDALVEEQTEARRVAAAEAISDGNAPIQAMWIYLMENREEGRSTITVYGAIDPYTPLPAQVSFHFIEEFDVSMIEETSFETGEPLGEIDFSYRASDLAEFENLVTYTFTLTEDHSFVAGFSIEAALFDTETEMGDAPLASFAFVPPNDLQGLVVGFVAPSPEHVGAGGREDVILLADTEDGEIYGIVREDVPGGTLQEYLIAFGSRESRDAALAEAAAAEAASAEATPGISDWITSPTGLISIGSALIFLVTVALIIILLTRQQKGSDDDDDSSDDNDDADSDGDEDEDGSEDSSEEEAADKENS